jgi:tetratricopeptide (TPR) repeat protein
MEQPSQPSSLQSTGGTKGTGILGALMPAVGMALLCIAAYLPLRYGKFFWDDFYWIVNNPYVHHWSGLKNIWFHPQTFLQYYPLTTTGFLVQWMLWGANPLGFHIVSVLLQIFNAIVLWRLLLRLGFKSAWLMAAIFAIHPVVVESVAWIVEQKNLISGALVLMAVWAWVRFAGLDKPNASPDHARPQLEWKFYALATVLYFLALLAKTYVCALPAAILVLTWWKSGRITGKQILASIPWFAFTAGAGLMAIWRERTGAGAMGHVFRFSIKQHLVIAGKDFWFYPAKLLWPYPIVSIYPRWHIAHVSALDLVYPLAAVLAVAGLFLAIKRIGRGPAAAAAIYVILVSPSLGFFAFAGMASTFVADHYFYLGCMSLIVLCVQLAQRWLPVALTRFSNLSADASGGMPQGFITACCAGVLLVLGVLSFRRCTDYRSVKAIWAQELRHNTDCPAAYDNLAATVMNHHEYRKAITLAKHAYVLAHHVDVVGPGIIGASYMHLRHFHQAIHWLRISLGPDPYYPTAIVQVAYCYEQTGRPQMAIKDLRRGLRLMPQSAVLYAALGRVLARQKQLRPACVAFQQAIEFEPKNAQYHLDYGQSLEQGGRWQAAIGQYQQALTLAPDLVPARFFLGRCLLRHGHPRQAIREFRAVIATSDGFPGVHKMLAKAIAAAKARRPSAQ